MTSKAKVKQISPTNITGNIAAATPAEYSWQYRTHARYSPDFTTGREMSPPQKKNWVGIKPSEWRMLFPRWAWQQRVWRELFSGWTWASCSRYHTSDPPASKHQRSTCQCSRAAVKTSRDSVCVRACVRACVREMSNFTNRIWRTAAILKQLNRDIPATMPLMKIGLVMGAERI